MNYRTNQKNGDELSILGYGCLRYTKKGTAIDQEKAEKEMALAVEKGVNYFDTAYTYSGSEVCLGKFLAKYGYRDRVKIATKLPHYYIKKIEDMERYFAEELERLQTDYIDYYLMHMLNDPATWQRLTDLGIQEWIREKKESGAIKNIGFSFHGGTAKFKELIDAYDWDFCQIQLNYMDTEHQAGLQGLAYAEAKGIPCVIMEPVKGGTLASLPEYASAPLKAAAPQSSIASWAFRYLAGFDNVRVILSGMSSEEQLEDNLGTFSPYIPLSDHEKVALDEAIAALKSRPNNGCTRCKYCMPCASGVEIPRIFSIWNEYQRYQNDAMAAKDYKDIPPYGRAQCCIRCGKCEAACPQKIKIRDELKAIASMPWAQA